MAKTKSFTVGPLATPEGVLNFPHIYAPETEGQYASGKYVTTLLIPKTADLTKLKAACLEAAQGQWPELKITTLGQVKLPFRDGDEKAEQRGFAGCVYIKCKSGYQPSVLGVGKGDKGEFLPYPNAKGGDTARLSVTAGAWKQNLEKETYDALKTAGKTVVDGLDDKGKKTYWRPAVTFYLNAVQIRKAGSFGGGGDASKTFDDGEMGDGVSDTDDMFG